MKTSTYAPELACVTDIKRRKNHNMWKMMGLKMETGRMTLSIGLREFEPFSDQVENCKFSNSHISLKQWNVLIAVARSKSFASAATDLHISQPVISYTLSNIEEHVGFPILQTEARKAKITEPGKELVEQVEPSIRYAAQLEEFARVLKKTCRPRICLLVDNKFPMENLLIALQRFSSRKPTVKVTLLEMPQCDIEMIMRSRNAELAVTRQLYEEIKGDVLIKTYYLPVAHPSHPLFALDRPLNEADLHAEIRLMVANYQDINAAMHPARNLWVVSSFDSAEKVLCRGIGFGWLPHTPYCGRGLAAPEHVFQTSMT